VIAHQHRQHRALRQWRVQSAPLAMEAQMEAQLAYRARLAQTSRLEAMLHVRIAQQEKTRQPVLLFVTRVENPSNVFCGGGQYVKNKNTVSKVCADCSAGKFSKDITKRE